MGRELGFLLLGFVLIGTLVATTRGCDPAQSLILTRLLSESTNQTCPQFPKKLDEAQAVVRPNPGIVGTNNDLPAYSSAEFLGGVSKIWTVPDGDSQDLRTNKPIGPESRKVLHHSLHDIDTSRRSATIAYGSGLVEGIIRAFQQDLHLILRPDDIWLAIMVQFSFYVNARTEEMRSVFVRHQGKEELVVSFPDVMRLEDLDVPEAARQFSRLIKQNLVDPDMTGWILPSFSTTTEEDVSVASLVMMGTMKSYFEYIIMMGCGFPSVTLLGERKDWINLLHRVEKLASFGKELANWSQVLAKVVEKMIEAYDYPDRKSTRDFWMTTAHQAGHEGSGLGLKTLSGWITAFCFWDVQGQRIQDWADDEIDDWTRGYEEDRKRLIIDDVSFPIIRSAELPRAVIETPIKIRDEYSRTVYEVTVVAGLMGMTATSSTIGNDYNTFQPRSGWWMLLDRAAPYDP